MICVEWKGKAYGVNRWLETNRYGTIYKNPGYQGFQEGLTWLMIKERILQGAVKGDVMVRIELTIHVMRDIDSLIKPILDCLETADVIENDRCIKHLIVRKHLKKRRTDPDVIRVSVNKMT